MGSNSGLGSVKPAAWIILVLMLGGCTAPSAPPAIPDVSAGPVSGNQAAYRIAVDIAKCLTGEGWDVKVDPTGGWGVVAKVPDEQRSAYDRTYSQCIERLGLADPEVTEASASADYDNNIRVAECLADHGFSVDEPPSRASFVSKSVESPDKVIWDPYALISEDNKSAAVMACPQ